MSKVSKPMVGDGCPTLAHLQRLSDSTGLIQHAIYTLPDRSTGYTTDDNARALLVALEIYGHFGNEEALDLCEVYLSFLCWVHDGHGKYRNFVGYDRTFLDTQGSEDCFGRVLWALGAAANRYPEMGGRQAALGLYHSSLSLAENLVSVRGMALAIRGLAEAPAAGQKAREILRKLADRLVAAYNAHTGRGWRWYEDIITYDNAAIPLSLFLAYEIFQRKDYLKVARESLDFLLERQMRDCFQPAGNQGWWVRGTEPALYDQQPIEAGSMVEAGLTAFRLTGKIEYRKAVEMVEEWFTGRNAAGKPLYDPVSGGCRDGVSPGGVNQNQGAESVLVYLWARLAIFKETQTTGQGGKAGEDASTVS